MTSPNKKKWALGVYSLKSISVPTAKIYLPDSFTEFSQQKKKNVFPTQPNLLAHTQFQSVHFFLDFFIDLVKSYRTKGNYISMKSFLFIHAFYKYMLRVLQCICQMLGLRIYPEE